MQADRHQRAIAAQFAGSPNINTLWAGILVDELARCGLREVCISPGSRSAPLVFQFAEHPDIVDYAIIDERSAAFFALGLARAKGRPIALLCTSGTAAANYFPAICEADRDNIPLLVLTGDRPPEDHECGATQVMPQAGLYGEHVRWHHQCAQPEPTSHKLAYLRSLACRAVHGTKFPRPGPVHIDLPFRKPLEPVAVAAGHPDHVPASKHSEVGEVIQGRSDNSPWLSISSIDGAPDDATIDILRNALERSRRPLFIAGTDPAGRHYREALRKLADHAAIPVMAEPASGLRHWSARGCNIIGAGDLIAGSAFQNCHGMPDLVIRTGSAPLSWAMQKLLADCRDAVHIAVGACTTLVDPEHVVHQQLIAEPGRLFDAVRHRLDEPDPDRRSWLEAHQEAASTAVTELENCLTEASDFSSPRMWHTLGALLPPGCGLYFSSSMPARHVDTFMCAHEGDLDVHFNRGLNGIDGVVSTASGIAAGRNFDDGDTPAPTLLVIGDIALRHDATALLLALEMNLDLTVIVVDNDGGEIFEYLPSAGFGDVHRKHFATSGVTPIAEAIPRCINLLEPTGWSEFGSMVSDSLSRGGLNVIRFPTNRVFDRRLRARLLERISGRIERTAEHPGQTSNQHP